MSGKKKPVSKSKHRKNKVSTKYKDGKREGKFCPKCGPGVFLAVHKNRISCGKCKYSEISTK